MLLSDEKGFIQTVKEMAHYLSAYSKRYVGEEYLGDWKAVRTSMSTGEVQATIYREVSQIIIIYGQMSEEYIEMSIDITPSFDEFLHKALMNYVKTKDCHKYKIKNQKVEMVQFKGVSEFFIFVDYYLHKFAEKNKEEENL